MRLTRGCRAGGGVACSSLEYGGIRAATSRTPAPRVPLSLSLFLSLSPHHLSQRSPSPLLLVLVSSPRRFPRERRFGPAIPSHPSPLVHLELSLSLSSSLFVIELSALFLREATMLLLPHPRPVATMTRALPILAPVFSSRRYPPLLLFRLETHSRGTMVVVVVVVERKRIRLVERAVQKAR